MKHGSILHIKISTFFLALFCCAFFACLFGMILESGSSVLYSPRASRRCLQIQETPTGICVFKKIAAEVRRGAPCCSCRRSPKSRAGLVDQAGTRSYQAHLLCTCTHWEAPELQKCHIRRHLSGLNSLTTRVAHNEDAQRAAQKT